jgi:hypothetical protein
MHEFLKSSVYADFVLSMTIYPEILGIITISDAELTQVLNVLPGVQASFDHFCGIGDRIWTDSKGEVASYDILQAPANHNNVGVFAVQLPHGGRIQLNLLVPEVK